MNAKEVPAFVPPITPAACPKPPRQLGDHGSLLWAAVNQEYQIADAGGVELLAQACAALDRAEQCADAIANDGVVVKQKNGPAREHPLIKAELANRSFVVRTLQKLGLDVEPVRAAPGRPPGVFA